MLPSPAGAIVTAAAAAAVIGGHHAAYGLKLRVCAAQGPLRGPAVPLAPTAVDLAVSFRCILLLHAGSACMPGTRGSRTFG